MSYGAWLKQQRTTHNLSQEALADMVGVDSTYINKIENQRVKRPYHPNHCRITSHIAKGWGFLKTPTPWPLLVHRLSPPRPYTV